MNKNTDNTNNKENLRNKTIKSLQAFFIVIDRIFDGFKEFIRRIGIQNIINMAIIVAILILYIFFATGCSSDGKFYELRKSPCGCFDKVENIVQG